MNKTRNRLGKALRLCDMTPAEQKAWRVWFASVPWSDLVNRKMQYGHLTVVQGDRAGLPSNHSGYLNGYLPQGKAAPSVVIMGGGDAA